MSVELRVLSSIKFTLAETGIEIAGHHACVSLLGEEYAIAKGNKKPDLRITIKPGRLDTNKRITVMDNFVCFKNMSEKIHGDIKYDFIFPRNLSQEPWKITILVDPKIGTKKFVVLLGDLVWRMLHIGYSSKVETIAKDIVYGVIEPALSLFMLPEGRAFLHASSVVNDSGTVRVFAGDGGVGKTTACLMLVKKKSYKFLSDDFLPLKDDGTAYLNPKKSMVYSYNTKGQKWLLEEVLRSRGLLDRVHWLTRSRIQCGSKVRRRLSLKKLFGEKGIGNGGKITKVFYLKRGEYGDMCEKSVNSKDMARFCSEIMAKEMKNLFVWLEPWSRMDDKAPKPEEVLFGYQKIYEKGFENAECKVLCIPKKWDPERLYKALVGMR